MNAALMSATRVSASEWTGSAHFAHKIGKRRSESMRRRPQWRWNLVEVFVKIRGERHCLWRAVDHESEVLESFVTKKRDKAAALKVLKKAMKRYGSPYIVVTDRCPSYRTAMKVIGNERRQETGRHPNNRAENSHPPFRRRERAMSRFRRMRSLQKFVSIHSSVHNHFNFDRHMNSRIRLKQKRGAALREWRNRLVAQDVLSRENPRRVRIRLTAHSGSLVRQARKRERRRNGTGSPVPWLVTGRTATAHDFLVKLMDAWHKVKPEHRLVREFHIGLLIRKGLPIGPVHGCRNAVSCEAGPVVEHRR